MRRLADDRIDALLRLEPEQRAFTQAWIDLFDWETPFPLRCRAVSEASIDAELSDTDVRTFHRECLEEELALSLETGREIGLHDPIDEGRIRDEPEEYARTLGSMVASIGYDTQFLLNAYGRMLRDDVAFVQRLDELRQWWIHNSELRMHEVAFHRVRSGRSPQPTMSVFSLADLSAALQQGITDSKWWISERNEAANDLRFLEAEVPALDRGHATQLVLENYEFYAAVESGRLRPMEIDRRWAFVADTHQWPESTSYSFRPRSFRFPIPAHPRVLVREAEALSQDDDIFKRIWFRYCRALKRAHVRRGDHEGAFDDVVKVLDIAYDGYTRDADDPASKFDLFAHKTALLLALNWSSEHFYSILTYLLKPSYAVEGQFVFGSDPDPLRIFDLLTNDAAWEEGLSRCSWDELLKRSRNRLLADWSALPETLEHRRREFKWDLARAVRSRHALFHRGEPLSDEYLLAALMKGVESVVLFRLVAAREGISFGELIHEAETQYEAIQEGGAAPDHKDTATRGWYGWRAVRDEPMLAR